MSAVGIPPSSLQGGINSVFRNKYLILRAFYVELTLIPLVGLSTNWSLSSDSRHHLASLLPICIAYGIQGSFAVKPACGWLRHHGIPRLDVLITSLGTEIYYAPRLTRDEYWNVHVDYMWRPNAVRRALSKLPGLEPQPKSEQNRFKVG